VGDREGMISSTSHNNRWKAMFKSRPTFFAEPHKYELGQEWYSKQLEYLASSLLIDDNSYPCIVDVCDINCDPILGYFPDSALISGSFLMSTVTANLTQDSVIHEFDDIDIYFKSKNDAVNFIKANGLIESNFDFESSETCVYGVHDGHKYNLIYGIEYENASDLISRFDIRACSIALDVNNKKLYYVRGSLQDATKKHIYFNPVPRSITVRRLIKYIAKGFSVEDSNQNLFFVELLKSHIYDPKLELITKKY
jgi:hypothetical protein